MEAIVYTSNTGFTEEYARLLSGETGLPAYELGAEPATLTAGGEVIFMGWLKAGGVVGYKKAAKKYSVKALVAVGMVGSKAQADGVRKKYALDESVPVFNLQGGFDMAKLHGLNKMMMKAMVGTVGKKLANKPDRTPEEDDMLDLMQNGGSRVSEDKLRCVLDWYGANK